MAAGSDDERRRQTREALVLKVEYADADGLVHDYTSNISQAPLAVTGVTAASRVYDGTAVASLGTGGEFGGIGVGSCGICPFIQRNLLHDFGG